MRTAATALLLVLALAAPAFAQTASIRFEPAAPDSHSAITARIGGLWADSGYPRCIEIAPGASPSPITLVAGCQPGVVLPAIMPWSIDAWLGMLQPGLYEVVVRQGSATGTVLARSALTVRDANPPLRLVPDLGYSYVGDSVRVFAPGLFKCNDTFACAAPAVRFGERSAQVIAIVSEDEATVRVPENEGGTTVDVTVEYSGSARTAVAAAMVSSSMASTTPPRIAGENAGASRVLAAVSRLTAITTLTPGSGVRSRAAAEVSMPLTSVILPAVIPGLVLEPWSRRR